MHQEEVTMFNRDLGNSQRVSALTCAWKNAVLCVFVAMNLATASDALACCGSPPPRPVQIPLLVVSCPTCASYVDLRAVAYSYVSQYSLTTPPGYSPTAIVIPQGYVAGTVTYTGSEILVTSSLYPLSSTFRFTKNATSGALAVVAISTASDAGAIAKDGAIYSRSAKVTISLPNNTHTDPSETIGGAIQGLILGGVTTTNLWHGLFPSTLGQVAKYTFYYNGVQYSIWSGDTLTVDLGDGYTVQVQWNPGAPITQWVVKWETLRDKKGNLVNVSNPTNSGAIAPQVVTTNPGSFFTGFTPFWDDTPSGSVEVGDLSLIFRD